MSPPPLLLGEDEARLYLHKPAGLPVFPPHADPGGDCVLARLLAQDPARATGWPPGFEGGIAHRLDTATSGLLLVARTPADLEPLRALFRAGLLRKFYRFRTHAPAGPPRVVELAIAHHPRRKDRMVVEGGAGRHRGKWYPAWTRFRFVEPGWWEAEIRTGVTHQVRVHAMAAGLGLDGDPIYGPPAWLEQPFALHHHRVVAQGWASPVDALW